MPLQLCLHESAGGHQSGEEPHAATDAMQQVWAEEVMCVAHTDAPPLSQPHAGLHFTGLGVLALRSLAAVADAVPSKFAWLVLTCPVLPIMDCSAGRTYLSMLQQTSRC